MASITAIANDFFAACETGKGWEVCKTYCAPNATFAAQAEPLAGIKTLAEYADWMKGLMTIMPDGSYEVKSFATDAERNNVAAYAVFSGTHTGPGGPCEPTGKKTASDYVYVMQFTDDTISHMTKIWNSGVALRELGWAERRAADFARPRRRSGRPVKRGYVRSYHFRAAAMCAERLTYRPDAVMVSRLAGGPPDALRSFAERCVSLNG